ncbi:WSC domain-containing protein [Plectosphaerella plurivora]|uniref:WSC domain-containing protein n=1 Tax=Plectosphaerella plurivora TaxID=936078 RepID=A0A9P9AEB3_9PEZI|nr:WSC domain-containing protein [Plectosphaerella plurivora]
MAPIRAWAALAAITLASTAQAWHVELPPCVDPFQPFLYTGCFANLDGKSLNYRSSTSSKDMTTEKCVAECKGNGYRYAGLEYGGVCYCGNTVKGDELDSSKCSFKCNGNTDEYCGGDKSMSLYSDPTFPPASDVEIENYVDTGCWTGSSSAGRTLSWPQDQLNAAQMTPDLCLSACRDGGFPFAGVEFGQECWCGVVLANDTQKVDVGECNMPCHGDASQQCGGRSRINIFLAKEFQSLEPCGHESPSEEPSVPLPSSSTSSTIASTSTTTSQAPPETTTTIQYPPITTPPPVMTTTKAPVTTTSKPAVCTTEIVTPPKDEYCCGKWCSSPLPDFGDLGSCLISKAKCKIQVASCLKYAGWPAALECFDFGKWCGNVSTYCSSKCKKGKPGSCSKKECFSQKPPKGGNKPTTTMKTVPCATTTTVPPTPDVPEPTNICIQPTNRLYGYGPGKPVGDVELPFVSCNDLADDWKQNPFKLYWHTDSRKCKPFKRPQVPGACADACKEQFDSCKDVYAKGCSSWGPGRKSRRSGSLMATSMSPNPAAIEKRFLFGLFKDSFGTATLKCKAQYTDCLKVNKNVTGAGKCTTYGGN